MITYFITGCGVTIICREDQDPSWFIKMVTERGGIVAVERA